MGVGEETLVVKGLTRGGQPIYIRDASHLL